MITKTRIYWVVAIALCIGIIVWARRPDWPFPQALIAINAKGKDLVVRHDRKYWEMVIPPDVFGSAFEGGLLQVLTVDGRIQPSREDERILPEDVHAIRISVFREGIWNGARVLSYSLVTSDTVTHTTELFFVEPGMECSYQLRRPLSLKAGQEILSKWQDQLTPQKIEEFRAELKKIGGAPWKFASPWWM